MRYWYFDRRICRKKLFQLSPRKCCGRAFGESMDRSSAHVYCFNRAWPACKDIHLFVRCIREKCFNTLIQSALYARRQDDENSNSSVFADTIKSLASSSDGCHIEY